VLYAQTGVFPVDLHNILVVDDEVSNLDALRRALRREYSVFTATNGHDALAIMEQNDIALIMADHRMPGITGIELLEKVWRKYPDAIRIILTSYTDEKLLMDAINMVHAHGYLTKPWEPEEITSIVGRWMDRYLKEQAERKEKDKQIEDLQRQLAEAHKAAEEASQRQLEQSQQQLPERRKAPWWRRWFRRSK
jgi:response regulator RpfG family c-di-GMP phosphodiesterase